MKPLKILSRLFKPRFKLNAAIWYFLPFHAKFKMKHNDLVAGLPAAWSENNRISFLLFVFLLFHLRSLFFLIVVNSKTFYILLFNWTHLSMFDDRLIHLAQQSLLPSSPTTIHNSISTSPLRYCSSPVERIYDKYFLLPLECHTPATMTKPHTKPAAAATIWFLRGDHEMKWTRSKKSSISHSESMPWNDRHVSRTLIPSPERIICSRDEFERKCSCEGYT